MERMYNIEERYYLDEIDPWYIEPPFEYVLEKWGEELAWEYYPEKMKELKERGE